MASSARGSTALLFAMLAMGCGKPLTQSECDELLDHYTEQLVLEEHPGTASDEVVQRQAEARELARREARYEFDKCPAKVSRRQFRCAMNAKTVDAIEQCLVL